MKHRNCKIKLDKFKELFYKKSMPIKEIAKYFNVTFSAIGSFRHRYNLPPRGWSNGIHPRLGSKISQQHKNKLVKIAKMRLGKKNPRWCGNKRKSYQGYILIRKPKHPFSDCCGWVREHRLIMEKHLGKILERDQNIHHINGIKDDNRLENLVVCSNSSHHSIYHKNILIKNLSNSPSHIKNRKAKLNQ